MFQDRTLYINNQTGCFLFFPLSPSVGKDTQTQTPLSCILAPSSPTQSRHKHTSATTKIFSCPFSFFLLPHTHSHRSENWLTQTCHHRIRPMVFDSHTHQRRQQPVQTGVCVCVCVCVCAFTALKVNMNIQTCFTSGIWFMSAIKCRMGFDFTGRCINQISCWL